MKPGDHERLKIQLGKHVNEPEQSITRVGFSIPGSVLNTLGIQ